MQELRDFYSEKGAEISQRLQEFSKLRGASRKNGAGSTELRAQGKERGAGSIEEMREWLVQNVKGVGWKEASHFLRNIGRTRELAILDRHILRNMVRFGFADGMPKSLTKNKYLELEQSFINMASSLEMKPAELDLLLWAKETGF